MGTRAALLEIPRPRLEAVAAPVRTVIESRLAAVRDAEGEAETASAYGELGVVLLAAEFFDSALPSLQNAATLAAGEPRWTYYLAHAHRRRGDAASAASWFERALVLDPGQAAASWWLASTCVDLNRVADADRLFAGTLQRPGFEVASLYGLGRSALAQQRFGEAAAYLERALAMNPRALAARYPLGLAYQRLGRAQDAEAQLRARGGAEIRPPDPWLDALPDLVESSLSHHSRGVAAGATGDWAKAADHFRRAVALDPEEGAAHLNLAVALHRLGDDTDALRPATRALELSPRNARAHLLAGLVLASLGRASEALVAYQNAAREDSRLPEARFALAELRRQLGRDREAVADYQHVLDVAPANGDARFGAALSMVRLRRFRDARDLVADGMRLHPDQPRFAHALARILATAPDAAVHDADRAIALTQALLDADASIDRATTMAMALAAAGRYREAAEWQQQAIAALGSSGDDAARARAAMQRNLVSFERRQPVRQPWPDDDPVHRPLPSVAASVVE